MIISILATISTALIVAGALYDQRAMKGDTMADTLKLACENTTEALLFALKHKVENAEARAEFEYQRAEDLKVALGSAARTIREQRLELERG